MKKLTVFFIAMIMVFTLEIPIFASNNTTGSITIDNVVEGQTYKIYKILDLESYDTIVGAYSYKINYTWQDFFATDSAKEYVNVDESNYATWIATTDDISKSNFTKLALQWAKDNNIIPTKISNKVIKNQTTVEFTNLELGYYLIDSTLGALCGLTTTNPNALINEKNGTPSIDKQVQEDSTNNWGDSNTADIGQTVSFCTTINVDLGAENYVLHDIMSNGLTFKKITKVELIDSESTITNLSEGTDYETISNNLNDDCTFEVQFTKSCCNSLKVDDKILVYYEAILNENAIIGEDGNPNETYLEYGENNRTTSDTTTTYTYEIDLIKTDSSNKLINGAKFKIYDSQTDGNEVKVVLMNNGNYRMAKDGEIGAEIEVKDGKTKIIGLDNNTYYLEETKAPDGYNILNTRKAFTIEDGNLNATFNNDIYEAGSGVQVVNKTGSIFPETGGMGTIVFISIGSILTIGTGIILVSRKRMSKIVDSLD